MITALVKLSTKCLVLPSTLLLLCSVNNVLSFKLIFERRLLDVNLDCSWKEFRYNVVLVSMFNGWVSDVRAVCVEWKVSNTLWLLSLIRSKARNASASELLLKRNDDILGSVRRRMLGGINGVWWWGDKFDMYGDWCGAVCR